MDNRDVRMSFELLYRQALNSEYRNEFYGVDADYYSTSEGVYRGALVALTGYQISNPEKRDDIISFLDENFGYFNEQDIPINQMDEEILKNFYDGVKNIIE